MSTKTEIKAEPADTSKCLARSVVEALGAEPTLEAVTINRARQTISVATLGKTDEPHITVTVTGRIQKAYDAGREARCLLLQGEGNCESCDAPLSEQERRNITIQHEGTPRRSPASPARPRRSSGAGAIFPGQKSSSATSSSSSTRKSTSTNGSRSWRPRFCAGVSAWRLISSAHRSAGRSWCSSLAYLAGGWFTAQEVWERLQKRAIDVHFLMLAVAAGSASIGAWGEGAMLLFLFSLSGALEHFALGRTQREIRSLFRDAPKFATVLDDAGPRTRNPGGAAAAGMRLLIKPGAQFPVDAEIVKGQTASDESNLTGEATPVEKAVGDTVLAGTMNLWGAVEVWCCGRWRRARCRRSFT